MKRKHHKRKFSRPKTKLGLPDLDQSKAAVLGSLRSPESQRGYPPIDEFNRMVLFGTKTPLQSNFCAALPNAARIPQFGSGTLTSGWLRFGDWRTRPRMLVYLARNWLAYTSREWRKETFSNQ